MIEPISEKRKQQLKEIEHGNRADLTQSIS